MGNQGRRFENNIEKSITLTDSPYTESGLYNCINVNTAGGNVRVNLPDVDFPIKINKTSSDSYLVTLYVSGIQIGEIAGELSSVTVESGQITKDEPWYQHDYLISVLGDEVVAKNKFGKCLSSTWRGSNTECGPVIVTIAALGGKIQFANQVFSGYQNIAISSNSSFNGPCVFDKLSISSSNLLNCSINDIEFTGDRYYACVGIGTGSSHVQVNRCLATDIPGTHHGNCFSVSCNGGVTRDILFNQCHVNHGGRFGFIVMGVYSDGDLCDNIRFNDCHTSYCGDNARNNDWITGFDLSEAPNISRMSLIGCTAEYCWESGIHWDGGGPLNQIQIIGGHARYNGQKYITTETYPITGFGAGIHSGSGNFQISDFKSEHNAGSGIFLSGARRASVSNCHTNNNYAHGIHIDAEYAEVAACSCIDEGKYGVFLFADINHVLGGHYSAHDYGIYVDHGPATIIGAHADSVINSAIRVNASNNIIEGCTIDTDSYGIWAAANGNKIINNVITVPTSTYKLRLAGNDNIIMHNSLLSGVMYAVGSGNIIKHNKGHVTENSGSSTGTGSEQTIAHGLAVIPTGCKAWIRYPISATIYAEKEIRMDATNIYPKVKTGLAYDWRVE